MLLAAIVAFSVSLSLSAIVDAQTPPSYPPVATPHIEITNAASLVGDTDNASLCLNDYAASFRASFQEIVSRMNGFIQQGGMCAAIPTMALYAGDIRMIAATPRNIAMTFVLWLSTTNSPSMSQVESCAWESALYAGEFTNWRQPIITPPFGCPRVDFVPPRFDNIGIDWICSY